MKIVWDKYMLAARALAEHEDRNLDNHWWLDHDETRVLFATFRGCGCLTQIRGCPGHARDAVMDEPRRVRDLVEEIIADDRVPASRGEVQLDHVGLFVHYQRRMNEVSR